MDIVIISVLGVWWLLSVFRQFDNRTTLWKWDVFCLIPRWTFFAPDPIRSDFMLLVRSEETESETWIRSPFLRQRTWRELIVNPKSRCNRVQYILTLRALEELRDGAGEASPHYRALAEMAGWLAGDETRGGGNFVVLKSFGFVADKPPQPVLVHPPRQTKT